MNINTYLRRKYGVETPTTMTAREARTLGIPYPLRAGWLNEHGARHITISQANRLHQQFAGAEGDFAARARVALLEVIEG